MSETRLEKPASQRMPSLADAFALPAVLGFGGFRLRYGRGPTLWVWPADCFANCSCAQRHVGRFPHSRAQRASVVATAFYKSCLMSLGEAVVRERALPSIPYSPQSILATADSFVSEFRGTAILRVPWRGSYRPRTPSPLRTSLRPRHLRWASIARPSDWVHDIVHFVVRRLFRARSGVRSPRVRDYLCRRFVELPRFATRHGIIPFEAEFLQMPKARQGRREPPVI